MRSSLLIATLFALTGAGCAAPDADIRLARLAAERRNLEATFDVLEERLVANQARVRFWTEMKARHESVTAIACASMEDHALEMAKRLMPHEQERLAQRSTLHQARVASASSQAAETPPPPRRRNGFD